MLQMLAGRVNTLRPSPVFEITAKAQELKRRGIDVISLAAGEPDFNTPEPIQKAAVEAMAKGITRYTPSAGFLALRELIAEKVSQDNDFPVSPEAIIVTPGAKYAIFLTLQCLAEKGHSVLLPTPAWVSYGPMIELAGASVFPLPLLEEDGFRPNLDRWKGMNIPTNARGIILNSPSNPTGVVLSREDLIKLVGWALQRDLWILADEIYEKILFGNNRHTSIASLGPEVRSCTITVSGCSKSYAMTGWRCGWAIGNKDLIKKMSAFQSQSISNVTSFVQSGAMAALTMPDKYVQEMVTAFDQRRGYCVERLSALSDDLSFVKPGGAFYFFINLTNWLCARKMNDVEFCKKLLTQQHVGLVPGAAFGKEKYVRLSYATSMENLEKSFNRLEEFLKATF